MQLTKHVKKIKQLLPDQIRRKVQIFRIIPPNNQPLDIIHQVKITANNAVIITKVQRGRAIGINVFNCRENPVFTRHIVGTLYPTAKRRSS